MRQEAYRGWLSALTQLILIAIACVAGYYLSREVDIIPKAILHLPAVHVSQADMWSLTRIFVATYALQIGLTLLLYRTGSFSNLKRFANEYLFYLFAYTSASLYSFLATTINYDPQLIAAIGLLSTLLYVMAMLVAMIKRGEAAFFPALAQVIGALLKRIASIPGVIAILYFLVPLAMGKAFTSDRDIANRITQIRIWFNPVETSEWGLKNLFPGTVFAQPVLVRQAPGDAQGLYVLERNGVVYRVDFPSGDNKQLALDISDQLGEVEVENGAVGLAFHPQFNQQKGKDYAYLYYTDTRPEEGQVNRLSRFDFSLTDPAQRKASEQVLLALPRTKDGFHNGGSVEFGPDGYLYIGLGEGVHPKRIKTSDVVLRSGILRLDVDMDTSRSIDPEPFEHGELNHYLVPKDNPFVGRDDIRNEYWALGLRNPFRFTFDPKNGDLWLGDVGSTIWEEVNLIEKGKHYQFPFIEGYEKSGNNAWEDLGLPEVGPVYTYQHSAYDRAVIGGMVYRGDNYPSLKGKYVFADNYSAKLFVMPADQPKVEEVKLIARANQYAQRGVSSVVQLDSGEILVTTLGAASEPSGEVLLLVKAEDADVFEEEPQDTTPKDYDEDTTAALYAVNCARCHGATGDGQGPDSGMLGVEMPDFTSPMFHFKRSAEDLHAVIEKGGVQMNMSPMMPPWGGFLKPQEIEHLVIYLQSLPDKHHHH
ncbi:PQQ-dependent sugar dehydrogenase [Aliiglaciecola sp. CAU 1673]|uniref:PQQ-dependent sugar dehydrogenase n=1 Tax=Aliiglaciecola sp. CAU 1673 TaxID=3032595 RepID=UPI0023DA9DD6|nr:PQQ-dependent sugar dehydrogenase [Aliiglaciecola sp. CAU 1673]MDF2177311.1 PQQ-dependent sugar dehydrogenase [Aliiglaciecola sp. CAU 1673]